MAVTEAGFFGRRDEYIGAFFVVPHSSSPHSKIDCSILGGALDVSEITIVRDKEGRYQRADYISKTDESRNGALSPCTRCNPLEPGVSVEPLGTTDIPCYGRDEEWVFYIRPDTSPDKVYDVQRECILQCPVVDECYRRFLVEQPVHGVLGGVTYRQYKKYGEDTLEVMRGKVNEDTPTITRIANAGPNGRGGRDTRGGS